MSHVPERVVEGEVLRGFYLRQVRRVLAAFPRESALILQYEHCCLDYDGQLDRTWEFLGLEPAFRPPSTAAQHAAARARSARLPRRTARGKRLAQAYAEDAARLAEIAPEIDLSLVAQRGRPAAARQTGDALIGRRAQPTVGRPRSRGALGRPAPHRERERDPEQHHEAPDEERPAVGVARLLAADGLPRLARPYGARQMRRCASPARCSSIVPVNTATKSAIPIANPTWRDMFTIPDPSPISCPRIDPIEPIVTAGNAAHADAEQRQSPRRAPEGRLRGQSREGEQGRRHHEQRRDGECARRRPGRRAGPRAETRPSP